ncbi:MAG: hypothetical protein JWO28_1063 [Hyphomicrobiales bacterium]|nr:hypothetical protein [Hyphomicrobiales bacterium]
MLGSGILDTVIGLIFVFLLVSMLVTISNELIAAVFRSRAKWLRFGIERLLGTGWAKDVYAHPLIEGTTKSEGGRGPSYIPSRSFANVLMALLHDSTGVQDIKRKLQSALDTASTASNPTVDTLKAQVATVAGSLRSSEKQSDLAMLGAAIKNDLAALGEARTTPYTVADAQKDIQRFIDGMPARYVRQMIEGLPDVRMRKTLLALYDDAQNDVEKFKENVETWFNNAMDRVNGWYKRRSQWVVAVLAVLAAVSMNVDAVLIVRHLQSYPGAREALVAQATAFADHPPASASSTAAAPKADPGTPSVTSGDSYTGVLRFKEAAATNGSVTLTSDTPGVILKTKTIGVTPADRQVPFTVDTDFSEKPVKATISAEGAAKGSAQLDIQPSLPAQFTAVQARLTDLGLPIGWVPVASPSQAQIKNGQVIPHGCSAILDRLSQHALGWLITALAATLGAPFWFDTLNRVISIRSAGKAPEEEPKPPKKVPVPLEPGQSPKEADRAGR